jgi:hypothetical protein
MRDEKNGDGYISDNGRIRYAGMHELRGLWAISSGRNRYLDIYWWKSFRYFHRKIEIRFFGASVEKRVIKDDPWIRRFS